jgi:tetratricopeptide (TPR) repeat protein
MNLEKEILDGYEVDSKDYFLLAARALFNKDFDLAIDYLNEVIKLEPDFARAYNGLALCYIRKRRYNEAIIYFDKALEKDNKITFIWVNKADLLAEIGFYEEALEAYNQASQLEPNNVAIISSKGWVLWKIGKKKEAKKLLKTAESIDPTSSHLDFFKGNVLMSEGDFDEAIKCFERYINNNSYGHSRAYYNIACAYALKGESHKSILYLKLAFLLEPGLKDLAREDKDLDNIKEISQFKELLGGVGKGN